MWQINAACYPGLDNGPERKSFSAIKIIIETIGEI